MTQSPCTHAINGRQIQCSMRNNRTVSIGVCLLTCKDYEGPERTDELKAKLIPLTVSRGVGDTIAKVTRAIGVKPCGGCKKRQEALNRIFPYERT
jgi:hypothetical protein